MANGIEHILKASIAVENGFLAAGVTISLVTLIQTVGIVVSWLR